MSNFTIKVPTINISFFFRKLSEINSIYRSLRLSRVFVEESSESLLTTYYEDTTSSIKVTTLQISYLLPKIKGWSFVGVLDETGFYSLSNELLYLNEQYSLSGDSVLFIKSDKSEEIFRYSAKSFYEIAPEVTPENLESVIYLVKSVNELITSFNVENFLSDKNVRFPQNSWVDVRVVLATAIMLLQDDYEECPNDISMSIATKTFSTIFNGFINKTPTAIHYREADKIINDRLKTRVYEDSSEYDKDPHKYLSIGRTGLKGFPIICGLSIYSIESLLGFGEKPIDRNI